MNTNNFLIRAPGVPDANRALTTTTSIVGALAGAAAGAIAGPLGIGAGMMMGALAGALAGSAMADTETVRQQYVDRLDREIGVIDGDLGAAIPPPPRPPRQDDRPMACDTNAQSSCAA